MTRSSLDHLRSWLGFDGPELVLAVQGSTTAQLHELVTSLLEQQWNPSGAAPANEIWPLVNARTSTFTSGGSNRWYAGTAGPAGLNIVAALSPRSAGASTFPDGLLRALLYCHGLVIEDPLVMAAELYAETPEQLRSIARSSVETATASLVQVGPLIDRGVVETFFTPSTDQGRSNVLAAAMLDALGTESAAFSIDDVWDAFEAGFVDGLSRPLQELWRRIRGGQKSPSLGLVEEAAEIDAEMAEVFLKVLTELRPRGVVENAVGVVASALWDLIRYGNSLVDMLCPSRVFAEIAFVGNPDPRHAVRLHQLAGIDVPRLDDLVVEDAIAIRQSSGVFSRWRHDLTTALERAHNLRSETDADPVDVVSETLTAARHELLGEVRRSRTLARHHGLLGFVAGGLGGALGGAAGGPVGVGLGAVGGLTPAVVERIFGTRELPRFADRHYLLFERGSGGAGT